MTTPAGAITTGTGYPSVNFGASNVGGAGGTLMGSMPLQQSLDTLTNAVNTLSTRISSINNQATQQQAGAAGPGGPGGGFPRPDNPFTPPQQPGMGGGGAGGAGNVQQPATFSGMAAAGGVAASLYGGFAGYGNQQLPVQLALNAYATQTAMAMGQTSSNFTQQYTQAFGYQNNRLNFMASSPLDAITGTQMLQSVAGNPMYQRSSMGQAGFGYAAAFANANPLASMATSAGFAQQIMSPQVSQAMMAMGYPVTPRQMGTGKANLPANVVQGMLRAWYGQKDVNPNTLTSGLGMYGKDTLSLNELGIDSSSAAPLIEEYNQLFRKGLSPQEAQRLINQSKSGSLSTATAAQKRLSSLGIKTATSSAQDMRNNQAVLTGRDADIASGFSRGLADATGMLAKFNNALSHIMTTLHLNGVTGYLGGFSSILSGTNSGNSILGIGGSIGSILGGVGNLFGGGGGVGPGMATMTPGASGGAAPSGGVIPQTSQGTPKTVNNAGTVSQKAIAAVQAAEGQLGTPYEWGGENPGVGFDCSGLVQWAYAQAGVNIPRTTFAMWDTLKNRAIPNTAVQEGDLVFMAGGDGTPSNPGHVGMMVGNSKLIQSPSPGGHVEIVGYDPRQWSHAVRPVGSLSGTFIGSTNVGGVMNTSQTGVGNSGMGIGFAGNYGSVNEVDALAGVLSGTPPVSSNSSFVSTSNATSPTTISSSGPGSGNSGGPAAPPNGPSGASAAVKKDIQDGKTTAALFGWDTGNEWNALYNLWMKESNWEWWAINPVGGNPATSAYGIPQALPGNKMGSRAGGPDWRNNDIEQISWGLNYIKQVYGDPLKAWAHEVKYNSYGAGGTLTGGISIVGDRGPEAIVGGAGSKVINNADTMKLINAKPQVAQNPWTVLDNNMSPYTPMSAGNQINLNFGKESIVVKVESNGSTTDASDAGTQVAKAIVKHIQDEQLLTQIGTGNKSGMNYGS